MSLPGRWRCPIRSESGSHVLALPHGGASVAGARLSGSGDDAGLLNVGASIRSSVPVTRVVGLVSNGVLRSPEAIAALGGVASVPLGADPKRRGHFVQSCWARTHADIRVTRSVRGERPECFTYHGLAFATVGVTPRRVTGGSDAVALASVSSRAGSFDGPSNTQMEPTRPTVLCNPVTAARGSFATLARQPQEHKE